MTTEFAQTKREVSGRSIMITSWFDEKRQAWRASAPGYKNVGVPAPFADPEACKSRQSAIEQVVTTLTHHFAEARTLQGEGIIFL